ncbi:MAG: hypothetical protein HY447_05610 [Candidatus Omnitrophica bacterium]|nr:hypothetical protein [Candidatus Omnitrophota bacterium]
MNEPFLSLSTVGVGSVPFKKEANSCKIIFEKWDIPFWPQYPARSLRENFLFQFLNSFPGLEISGRVASFDEAKYLDGEKEYLEKLRQAFLERDFIFFEPDQESALGYSEMKDLLEKGFFPDKGIVKLQITGPGTLWQSFFSSKVSKKNSENVLKAIVDTLIAAGLAQIERVSSYGRAPLIVIDEPIRFKETSYLKGLVDSFGRSGAWAGLHVCSNFNWTSYEDLPLNFFHFDASTSQVLTLENRDFLKSLLKQDGWIAWGIVPTARDSAKPKEDYAFEFRRRVDQVSGKDLSIKDIFDHSLIAPACGTGMLTEAEDERVWQNVLKIQETLRSEMGIIHTL